MKHSNYFLIAYLLIAQVFYGQGNIGMKLDSVLDNAAISDFSGAILIAKNNQLVDQRAYGFASIEYEVPNTINTRFNIASITKMITAVAVLQLVEKGLVDLNVPIGTYLPSYPNVQVRDAVTIHQLLTHTSGLNNFYVEDEFAKADKTALKSVSDFNALFAHKPLLSRPGEKYNYGASGFVVLGLIIENVTGMSYYEYVDKNIFEPAKMNTVSAEEVDGIRQNTACGYTTFLTEDHSLKRNDYYLSKASPGGFYYATIEDLFRFSKALRAHELLSEELTDVMFAPKVKGYNTNVGYGIDVDERYNQTILGHSGGWYGVRGEVLDFMKDGYTVVILSNVDDNGKTGTTKLANVIKEIIAGEIELDIE